jgi:hypothetical protein
MAGSRDGFPSHCHLVLLYMDANLSLMGEGGSDVKGMRYHLHWPTNGSWQVMVQSLLTGVFPSRCTIWADAAPNRLPWGARPQD